MKEEELLSLLTFSILWMYFLCAKSPLVSRFCPVPGRVPPLAAPPNGFWTSRTHTRTRRHAHTLVYGRKRVEWAVSVGFSQSSAGRARVKSCVWLALPRRPRPPPLRSLPGPHAWARYTCNESTNFSTAQAEASGHRERRGGSGSRLIIVSWWRRETPASLCFVDAMCVH